MRPVYRVEKLNNLYRRSGIRVEVSRRYASFAETCSIQIYGRVFHRKCVPYSRRHYDHRKRHLQGRYGSGTTVLIAERNSGGRDSSAIAWRESHGNAKLLLFGISVRDV